MPIKKEYRAFTREDYCRMFGELWKTYDYTMEQGEAIVQAIEPYPPYWFISNCGKIFSIPYGRIRQIKPTLYLLKKAHQQWKIGYSNDKGRFTLDMSTLIAKHFLADKIKIFEDAGISYVVHHIKPTNSFKEDEAYLANRVSNLQVIPMSLHTEVTNTNFEKKIKKAETTPVIRCSNLTDYIEDLLKQMPPQLVSIIAPEENGGKQIGVTSTGKIEHVQEEHAYETENYIFLTIGGDIPWEMYHDALVRWADESEWDKLETGAVGFETNIPLANNTTQPVRVKRK